MNRQQRRKIERDFKKKGEDCFVGSNPGFLTLQEAFCPIGFQKEPIVFSGVFNKNTTKIKKSSGLVFENEVVKVLITPEKKGVEITTILVCEEFLSQGLGKLMLDFLLVNFRMADIDYVSLYPQKKDPNDQISLAKCQKTLEEFYSKRGFEWNKGRTEMVLNWEKFEVYEKINQVIENLDFERILNPRRGMGLMAA
jgi:hypothetical protein